MYIAPENSGDPIKNESYLEGVYRTIQLTSKYMCIAHHNNEDYTRDESYLPELY